MQTVVTIRARVGQATSKLRRKHERSGSELGETALDAVHVGMKLADAIAEGVNIPGLKSAVKATLVAIELIKV